MASVVSNVEEVVAVLVVAVRDAIFLILDAGGAGEASSSTVGNGFGAMT